MALMTSWVTTRRLRKRRRTTNMPGVKSSRLFLAAILVFALQASAAQPGGGLFETDNLVAWCVVPFDAKKRGPEERAAMLEKLGFKHFAYDYRAEHVPTFDAEVEALKRHGVSLDAWWFPRSDE